MKKYQYKPMGSISFGTLNSDDLIHSLLWEVSRFPRRVLRSIRKEHRDVIRAFAKGEEISQEDKDSLLESLFEALDANCLPYFYFGSHPGDGADIGYWLPDDFDYFFDGLRVNDLSKVPKDYFGEVLEVNDHGNATLYFKNKKNKFREIWGIV